MVVVRYLNSESASEQVILSHSKLASGINLRTDDEAQHLLQLAVCKQSDAFVYSSHSNINSANKALLHELLSQTCQVRASASMVVCIYHALNVLICVHLITHCRHICCVFTNYFVSACFALDLKVHTAATCCKHTVPMLQPSF